MTIHFSPYQPNGMSKGASPHCALWLSGAIRIETSSIEKPVYRTSDCDTLVINDVQLVEDCHEAGFEPYKPFHFTDDNKDHLRDFLETQQIIFNSVAWRQITDAIARHGYALVP